MIDFLRNVAELSGLPFEECFAGYRYAVISGRVCYVARHKGIKSFSDAEIILKINKSGQLVITGSELIIKHLTSEDLMVTGEICGVKWRGDV